MPLTRQCPYTGCSKTIVWPLGGDGAPKLKARCPHCGRIIQRKPRRVEVAPESSATEADTASGDDEDFSAVDEPAPPPTVGRYMVKERIGAGAFATVYRAVAPQTGDEVALKVPHPGSVDSDRASSRFLREVNAVSRLKHPNIVPFLEVLQGPTGPILVSRLVIGSTLAQVLESHGPFSPRRAARIIASVASALNHAHDAGVIHRDVKPSNILIDVQGRPMLTDFGLARLTDARVKLTKAGAVLGTPAYLSPEQARGDSEEIGHASDQYNLGVTLYELLAGRTPFDGPTHAILYQTVSQPIPPPSRFRAGLPPELEAICLKALERVPAQRHASCEVLAEMLLSWAEGSPENALASTDDLTQAGSSQTPNAIGSSPAPLKQTIVDSGSNAATARPGRPSRILAAVGSATLIGIVVATAFFLRAKPAQKGTPRPPLEAGVSIATSEPATITTQAPRPAVTQAPPPPVAIASSPPQTDPKPTTPPPPEKPRPSTPATELTASEIIRPYAKRIEAAWRASLAGRPAEALQGLESCAVSHRGWEWHYLRARAGEPAKADLTLKLPPRREPVRLIFASDSQRLGAVLLERNPREKGAASTASLAIWSVDGPILDVPARLVAVEPDLARAVSLINGENKPALMELPINGRPSVQGRFSTPAVSSRGFLNARMGLARKDRRVVVVVPLGERPATASSNSKRTPNRSGQTGTTTVIEDDSSVTVFRQTDNGFSFGTGFQFQGDMSEMPMTPLAFRQAFEKMARLGTGKNPVKTSKNVGRVSLQVWNSGEPKATATLPETLPDGTQLRIIDALEPTFAPTGDRIAVRALTARAGDTGANPATRVLLYRLDSNERGVTAGLIAEVLGDRFGFSPDGSFLATSDPMEKQVIVRSARDGREWARIPGIDFAFHPGSRQLATWGDDLEARTWDLGLNATPPQPKAHFGIRRSLAFGPGQRLTALDEGGAVILDPATGTELLRFPGPLQSATPSPDGHHLASIQDGAIVIRSARDVNVVGPGPIE